MARSNNFLKEHEGKIYNKPDGEGAIWNQKLKH